MSPIDLLDLCPQTGQRRPSVEFIPQPYGPPERHGGGHPASSAGNR